MLKLLDHVLELIDAFLPALATIAIVFALIAGVKFFLERRSVKTSDSRFRLQMILLIMTFTGLLAIIMALPISENTRGQLLSLIGLLLSAAIALSATTFVGNMMAGLMLRAVKSFRIGDFIRCGEYFGRVSERGLFHIEIQTEDRDLTSLPNLFLVTNPVRVVQPSGTMVNCEITLGYDISRTRIRTLLLEAVAAAGLQDGYVHVTELGNFSVAYRVAGFLPEVKNLLSTRSRLKEAVLDSLHNGGVEIVSPTFMNTRAYTPEASFIPKKPRDEKSDDHAKEPEAEARVFDKADEAESTEKLKDKLAEVADRLKESEQACKETEDEAERTRREAECDRLRKSLARLQEEVSQREAKKEKE